MINNIFDSNLTNIWLISDQMIIMGELDCVGGLVCAYIAQRCPISRRGLEGPPGKLIVHCSVPILYKYVRTYTHKYTCT